uniref:Taste receptor type 2 n=1 Tax=Erpetoichthys calabaricus TaxID=27687 RepID=A0A8C4RS83_ERPCA
RFSSNHFTILLLLSVGGFGSNLFIVLCMFLHSGEDVRKKLGPSATLAFRYVYGANLFLCVLTPTAFLQCLDKEHCGSHELLSKVLAFLFCIPLYDTMWFTAILCLFYCSKILQSQNSLFVKIKHNIFTRLRWSLASGILLNSVTACCVFAYPLCIPQKAENITEMSSLDKVKNLLFVVIYGTIYIFLPFAVLGLSCLSILAYLCRHIVRMRRPSSDIAQPRLESQERTVVLLSIQVLLYTLPVAGFYRILLASEPCDTMKAIAVCLSFSTLSPSGSPPNTAVNGLGGIVTPKLSERHFGSE